MKGKTMKSIRTFAASVILAIITVFAMGATYVSLSQVQLGYMLIRGPVNTTDSGTTSVTLATGGDFAHKPAWVEATHSGAFEVKLTQDAMPSFGSEFITSIVDASGNNAACNITYWVWRKDNGPAVKAFTVTTATCGTQAVVKYIEDGTTATNAYWITSGTVTSYAVTAEAVNSGNSGVLLVRVADWCGYRWVYPEVTSVSSGAAGAYGIRVYKADY